MTDLCPKRIHRFIYIYSWKTTPELYFILTWFSCRSTHQRYQYNCQLMIGCIIPLIFDPRCWWIFLKSRVVQQFNDGTKSWSTGWGEGGSYHLTELSSHFRRCRHFAWSSDRLLRTIGSCMFRAMVVFSAMHKLQRWLPAVYGLALVTTDQEME